MADGHLRDLERRAAGDVASAAELLRARQRAGELSAERLQLAASLGHEAARGALSDPPTAHTTAELFALAPSWGWEAITRAMLALALDPRTAKVLAGYQSRLYRESLDAALAVLESPNDDDARHLAHEIGRVDVPFTFARWEHSQEGLYALCAARCAAVRDQEDLAWTWSVSLHAMLDVRLLEIDHRDERWALRYTRLGHDTVPTVGERLAHATQIEGQLRRGISAWALGEPLPLRAGETNAHLDALR